MLGPFLRYGLILQAIAIVHFLRRRPDTFWLWIIIVGGGLGALVYIVAEVIPDFSLLRGTFEAFPRRRQITQLEAAVLDNPAVGNYEELGNLYLDDGQYAKARECFDRVITPRTDTLDPHYRRALALLALGELKPAADDLARVVRYDPKYRLSARGGTPGRHAGQARRTRTRSEAVRRGHDDLDAVGDAIQLRGVSRRRGPHYRSARVGAAGSREEAHDARLPAAARTSVVPSGGCTLEEAPV